MQKIVTHLWFDQQAEEAVNFYTSIFKNSKIGAVARYNESGPGAPGSVMTIRFELEGQQFIALNGGPEYQFNPAISLFVYCESQEELDRYWNKFSEGGTPVACGWITDKYGVSWQIVPTVLIELLENSDPAKAKRVMDAMLKMVKLDIKTLQAA